jgi:hypothetical protein
MIEMAVRNENIDVTDALVFDELQPERAQSCAGVKN